MINNLFLFILYNLDLIFILVYEKNLIITFLYCFYIYNLSNE